MLVINEQLHRNFQPVNPTPASPYPPWIRNMIVSGGSQSKTKKMAAET